MTTALLSSLAAIVLLLLKVWVDSRPAKTKEDRDEVIQQGRTDIADGNADAVSNIELRISADTSSDTIGKPSTEDIERRISEL